MTRQKRVDQRGYARTEGRVASSRAHHVSAEAAPSAATPATRCTTLCAVLTCKIHTSVPVTNPQIAITTKATPTIQQTVLASTVDSFPNGLLDTALARHPGGGAAVNAANARRTLAVPHVDQAP